ncbi:MAG: SpoIIE family protein phosphatase [Candidatus Eremiobacteraeota bacterium]|nr:SpoIIE family protein phosphatase [Candidatus Eremiobacteraeota bacterium]
MRIRTQAVLLSVVPLTFLIVLFIIATVLQTKTDQTATWSQRSTTALKQSDQISRTISAASSSVVQYTTKRAVSESLTGYRAAVRDVPAQVAELRTLVRDEPGQDARVVRYGAAAHGLLNVLGRYVALWQTGKNGQAQAKAVMSSAATQKQVDEYTGARHDFEEAERVRALSRYDALHRDFGWLGTVLLVSSIAGIVLTLFVTARFGLRIARRLRRLAENARRLGRGEETVPIGGSDEIADLDTTYHQMTRMLKETHHVASTLQRALLPQGLPDVAGIDFDGVYEPGKSEAQVGGDWYDAVRLADGRVLVSIGDVAGSGLQSAVIMAAMREVIRGVAQVYADPATMIDAADRTLKSEHPDSLVTAFVAVFDPIARTLAYCSAGHPPPLLRLTDGTVVDLPSQGLPLGIRARDDVDARSTQIPDGATVLFYTDGLTESTRDVVAGEQRLRDALANPAIASQPNLAQAIYDDVLRDGTHDDVAILAMRLDASRTGTSTEVVGRHLRRWAFDTGDHATAQRSRAVFASVLAAGGMLDEDVFTSELIFGELLSNTVRYAPGAVEVVLDWSEASTAILHFLDSGPGFVLMPRLPSDLLSERGRGLFLIWSMSEDFNVTKRPDGGAHARVVLSPRRKRSHDGAARPGVAVGSADTVS